MDGIKQAKADLRELKDPGYEIFIIAVSVLSVANLFLTWLPGLDPDAVDVVEVINFFLSIIFVLDFIYRMYSADSKTHYFFRDWGWADLLASLPALRILRLFRIVKAYHLLTKYGARNIFAHAKKHRADSVLYIVFFSVMVVIEVGAFLVLMAERQAPDANIVTASDAMWWVYVTIATVGYGDRFPVTTAGRLVGILVMTTGVGLFGTIAGFVANKLLAPVEPDTDGDAETQPATCGPGGDLAEIRDALKEQARQNAEMAARLDRIEREIMEKKKGE